MSLIYNLAFFIFGLVYLPIFLVKIRQAEDRRELLRQRLGLFSPSLREKFLGKKVLWIHAVSVGEVVAVQKLIEKFLEACPDYHLVMTTVTPAGQKIAKQMESDRLTACYFPFDFTFSVRNFFKVMGPECLLLVETEIWPNHLTEAKESRVPVGIINARLSSKSVKRYKKFLPFFKPLFNRLDFIFAQSPEDSGRFESLGIEAPKIQVLGNMKFDNIPEIGLTSEALRDIRKKLGFCDEDRIFIAGSTHPGEEEAVAEAFLNLSERYPELKCLIAPRHIERSNLIAARLRKKGLKVRLASEPLAGNLPFQVLLLDQMGILKQLYAISDVVFMGGSFIRHGGQNPIEPAYFKRAILHGPFVFNFGTIYQMLDQEGGALLVRDEDQLRFALGRLLEDPKERTLLGKNAFEVVSSLRGATDRHLEECLKFLTSKSKVERVGYAEYREKLLPSSR